MKKSVLLYSVAVAAGAFLLKWLEYQYAVRVFSTEIYIAVIAFLFAGLGVWAGIRMATPKRAAEFVKNEKAIEYMGISNREYEVLELLAQGCSNREIGEKMFVSGNTVKSHLARLYQKLDVSRRTQAIQRARAIRLIP